MKRSALYTAPGTLGTATSGHGYGSHTRLGARSSPCTKICVFIAMSPRFQPAASGTPMRLASAALMRMFADFTASSRSLLDSWNIRLSLYNQTLPSPADDIEDVAAVAARAQREIAQVDAAAVAQVQHEAAAHLHRAADELAQRGVRDA